MMGEDSIWREHAVSKTLKCSVQLRGVSFGSRNYFDFDKFECIAEEKPREKDAH